MIQDITGVVVIVGRGCRTGEVLLNKDYNEDTTMIWKDAEIAFKNGVPNLENAVVELRLRNQKGFKTHKNHWRGVIQ